MYVRDQDEAIALYEKLGFRRDHTDQDDEGEVVYLVRDLDPVPAQ